MRWAAHLLPAPLAAAGWGPLIPSPGSRYSAKDRAGSRCWQSLHMLSKLDLLLLHCLVLKRETGLACGSCFYYSLPAFYKMTRAERARGVRKHGWEFMSVCVGFPRSAVGLGLVPAHLCPALSICHTYSTTRLLPLRGWELSERSQQLPSNCSAPGASASPKPETGPGLLPGCPALHRSRASDQGEPSSPAVQMRPLLLYVISGSSSPSQCGVFISHYFSDV